MLKIANKALLLQAKHLNSWVNYAPGVAVAAGTADATDEDETDEEDEEGKGNEDPPQVPVAGPPARRHLHLTQLKHITVLKLESVS